MAPPSPSAAPERTTCCIAGCGPAGAMLGFLLAPRGVEVLVLEKHADFLRDFRGDTIHPSTLQITAQLGLAERLLRLPQSEVSAVRIDTPRGPVTLADLARLRLPFPFIAFMPQWDILDFVTAEAAPFLGRRTAENDAARTPRRGIRAARAPGRDPTSG